MKRLHIQIRASVIIPDDLLLDDPNAILADGLRQFLKPGQTLDIEPGARLVLSKIHQENRPGHLLGKTRKRRA